MSVPAHVPPQCSSIAPEQHQSVHMCSRTNSVLRNCAVADVPYGEDAIFVRHVCMRRQVCTHAHAGLYSCMPVFLCNRAVADVPYGEDAIFVLESCAILMGNLMRYSTYQGAGKQAKSTAMLQTLLLDPALSAKLEAFSPEAPRHSRALSLLLSAGEFDCLQSRTVAPC